MSGESYTGVKFNTIRLSESFSPTPLSAELLEWCHEFARLGLAPSHSSGSYGNMSIRTSPGKPEFLITRTAAMLADITEQELVLVERIDIQTLSIWTRGQWEPSSETFIHARLYEERPDINAIFHGHSSEILALAQIPTTPKELPYGTMELADAALQLKDHPIFNICNHGFFSLGETMAQSAQQSNCLIE